MKKYTLKLNETQARCLSRMLKTEILQQREWKKDDLKLGKKDNLRDFLAANMWELIEQLCKQNPTLEYWEPYCCNRTDEEEEEMENVE